MPEHGAKVGLLDEDVCILLHSAARLHAAESDEEIDSRLRFEIAHAVADECRLSVRARAWIFPSAATASRSSSRACASPGAERTHVRTDHRGKCEECNPQRQGCRSGRHAHRGLGIRTAPGRGRGTRLLPFLRKLMLTVLVVFLPPLPLAASIACRVPTPASYQASFV